MSDGPFAFALRAALVRNARRSLDLQYYIWHSDVTGRLMAREVIAAADRGVRVRLLLDDLDARGRRLLARRGRRPSQHRSAPVQPVRRAARAAAQDRRSAHRLLAHQPPHAQQEPDRRQPRRDLGGRNIGDEYFSASKEANFADLDFAMVGPVVAGLSRTFDRYWNSEAVWPIAALLPKHAKPEDLVELRAASSSAIAQEPEAQRWLATLPGNAAVAAFVAGQMPLHWTERWQVLADDPLKARLGDARHTRSDVLRGLSQAMRESNARVVLISPYFVPGDAGREVAR